MDYNYSCNYLILVIKSWEGGWMRRKERRNICLTTNMPFGYDAFRQVKQKNDSFAGYCLVIDGNDGRKWAIGWSTDREYWSCPSARAGGGCFKLFSSSGLNCIHVGCWEWQVILLSRMRNVGDDQKETLFPYLGTHKLQMAEYANL